MQRLPPNPEATASSPVPLQQSDDEGPPVRPEVLHFFLGRSRSPLTGSGMGESGVVGGSSSKIACANQAARCGVPVFAARTGSASFHRENPHFDRALTAFPKHQARHPAIGAQHGEARRRRTGDRLASHTNLSKIRLRYYNYMQRTSLSQWPCAHPGDGRVDSAEGEAGYDTARLALFTRESAPCAARLSSNGRRGPCAVIP